MQLDEFDARSVALIDFLVCHLAEAKQRVVQSFSMSGEQGSLAAVEKYRLEVEMKTGSHGDS